MDTTDKLVAKLDFEPVRKVFRNEAQNFTTWLEQNLDVLAERLGIDINLVEREKKVGDFNVDLECEDGEGNKIIIENQLEKTDHDHLGKLLTYLVNLEAKTAIWVTGAPREEHQKVIDWLNQTTPLDLSFYLVKVEAVKIAGSPSAPLFTVVAAPTPQDKVVGGDKKDWADRHFKRMEFWKQLLEKAKSKTRLFSAISPSRYNWIGTGAGRSGVNFNYSIGKNSAVVDLYIDCDRETGAKNKAIFDALQAQKEVIEKEFGEPLVWERLDGKRASRIRKNFIGAGLATPESWASLQEQMIDSMIRLDKSLRSRLAKL